MIFLSSSLLMWWAETEVEGNGSWRKWKSGLCRNWVQWVIQKENGLGSDFVLTVFYVKFWFDGDCKKVDFLFLCCLNTVSKKAITYKVTSWTKAYIKCRSHHLFKWKLIQKLFLAFLLLSWAVVSNMSEMEVESLSKFAEKRQQPVQYKANHIQCHAGWCIFNLPYCSWHYLQSY